MSAYNLFSQPMSYLARVLLYSFRDQLQPVLTGFLRFFAVPVHGSCILKLSGTCPVRGPSKKGNRTETGPDFKALNKTAVIEENTSPADYRGKDTNASCDCWKDEFGVVCTYDICMFPDIEPCHETDNDEGSDGIEHVLYDLSKKRKGRKKNTPES